MRVGSNSAATRELFYFTVFLINGSPYIAPDKERQLNNKFTQIIIYHNKSKLGYEIFYPYFFFSIFFLYYTEWPKLVREGFKIE